MKHQHDHGSTNLWHTPCACAAWSRRNDKIIHFHFTKHANLQHLCAKIFVTRVCFTLGSSRHENKWDFNEHVKKVVAVYGNESKINFVSIKRQSEHSHKLIKVSEPCDNTHDDYQAPCQQVVTINLVPAILR